MSFYFLFDCASQIWLHSLVCRSNVTFESTLAVTIASVVAVAVDTVIIVGCLSLHSQRRPETYTHKITVFFPIKNFERFLFLVLLYFFGTASEYKFESVFACCSLN